MTDTAICVQTQTANIFSRLFMFVYIFSCSFAVGNVSVIEVQTRLLFGRNRHVLI